MAMQKCQGRPLGLTSRGGAFEATLDQPRFTMCTSIPLVHCLESRLAYRNRKHWPHGDLVELIVGNQSRNLDDVIGIRIEPGHFQVDPDQVGIGHRG